MSMEEKAEAFTPKENFDAELPPRRYQTGREVPKVSSNPKDADSQGKQRGGRRGGGGRRGNGVQQNRSQTSEPRSRHTQGPQKSSEESYYARSQQPRSAQPANGHVLENSRSRKEEDSRSRKEEDSRSKKEDYSRSRRDDTFRSKKEDDLRSRKEDDSRSKKEDYSRSRRDDTFRSKNEYDSRSRKEEDSRSRKEQGSERSSYQRRNNHVDAHNQRSRDNLELTRNSRRYHEPQLQNTERNGSKKLMENASHGSNEQSGKVVDGKYVSSKQPTNRIRKPEYRERNTDRYERRDGANNFRKDQVISKQFHNKPSLRPAKKSFPIDSEQARTLIDQLIEESYECMVCCEWIRSSQQLWSCQNCYHLFHLRCIKEWAGSEINQKSEATNGDSNGWRCPACRNVTGGLSLKYTCFCGKVTDPDWNPKDGVTPHSCGELCWKQRKNPPCSHTCNELCHPGPCPSCPVMVSKECHCGKTSTKVRCGHIKKMKCSNICGKILKCGRHNCTLLCHEGPCQDCEVIKVQKCYCGKETCERQCGDGLGTVTLDDDGIQRYPCENACSKLLDCGNHNCKELCHNGDCASCVYLPQNVNYCPCKQTLVSELLPSGKGRRSCLDPIPCCGNFCGKRLLCGPKGQSHLCRRTCHTGECGPCEGTTVASCRCGNTETELPCKEYDPGKQFTCERRCNKKRKCGRHRCNQKCCVDAEHNCNLICGRKLGCGLHKCDEVCHTGNCPRCWQTSFDERLCYCGETVQYPPIPCGTPMPECDNRCTRTHPCGHQPKHNCHNEDACPPCVVLVEKRCLCKQETRHNVPCHINIVSCGKPCGKELRCGQHKCLKICHKDGCLGDEEHCQQPCPNSRRDCPHPCGAPCHVGQECPEGACKNQITIKCRCGRKTEKVLCLSGNSKVQFQRFATDSVGDKLRNLRSGQSVDISGLMIAEKRGGLDCDEECAMIERNKRLAEALGIDNPDGNHFHSLPFSYFIKEEAKKQLPLVKLVEEAIETLIQKIKKSSILQISHSFQPMNSTQRRLVHEVAEHYNCKTVSYDQEPKRNTVVTATRDSILVVPKLSSVIERKNKPLSNPILNLEEKPLNFQRMQKKSSQDDESVAKASTVDYFDDDF